MAFVLWELLRSIVNAWHVHNQIVPLVIKILVTNALMATMPITVNVPHVFLLVKTVWILRHA